MTDLSIRKIPDLYEGDLLPFSACVLFSNLIFVSGTPGIRQDRSFANTFLAQANDAFRNLNQVLIRAGSCAEDVLKTNIFLVDSDHLAQMNVLYCDFFNFKQKPARTTIIVHELPDPAMLIEIDCIAAKKNGHD